MGEERRGEGRGGTGSACRSQGMTQVVPYTQLYHFEKDIFRYFELLPQNKRGAPFRYFGFNPIELPCHNSEKHCSKFQKN